MRQPEGGSTGSAAVCRQVAHRLESTLDRRFMQDARGKAVASFVECLDEVVDEGTAAHVPYGRHVLAQTIDTTGFRPDCHRSHEVLQNRRRGRLLRDVVGDVEKSRSGERMQISQGLTPKEEIR